MRRGAWKRAAFVALLCALVGLAGCEKVEVAGRYRDPSQEGLFYELRPDGTWTAEWEKKVPMGLFPQGEARRLQGVYELRGRRLELTCLAVEERDPVSVGFAPVRVHDGDGEALRRQYDHAFDVREGTLVPLDPDHPFGGGELVPVGDTE
jgi:hypothetical protein